MTMKKRSIGRPASIEARMLLCMPKDVADIVENCGSNKTKYVCDAIRLKHAVDIANSL